MHRKQFQAIADVLLAARKEWGNSPTNAEHVIYDIESKLAMLFKSENNLFDRSRFERASRPANWTQAKASTTLSDFRDLDLSYMKG